MLNCAKALPATEYLAECFRLDADTGQLFWKVRPVSHFTCEERRRRFNTRHAGKRADRVNRVGYWRVRVTVAGTIRILASHRVIFKMTHGRDAVPTVDHIDRDPRNNRPVNLREASYALQNENRTCGQQVSA